MIESDWNRLVGANADLASWHSLMKQSTPNFAVDVCGVRSNFSLAFRQYLDESIREERLRLFIAGLAFHKAHD
jgi:hypothetical protein